MNRRNAARAPLSNLLVVTALLGAAIAVVLAGTDREQGTHIDGPAQPSGQKASVSPEAGAEGTLLNSRVDHTARTGGVEGAVRTAAGDQAGAPQAQPPPIPAQIQAMLSRTGEPVSAYESYERAKRERAEYVESCSALALEKRFSRNDGWEFLSPESVYEAAIPSRIELDLTTEQQAETVRIVGGFLADMEQHWRSTDVPTPEGYKGLEDYSFSLMAAHIDHVKQCYQERSNWVDMHLPALEAALVGVVGPPADGEPFFAADR